MAQAGATLAALGKAPLKKLDKPSSLYKCIIFLTKDFFISISNTFICLLVLMTSKGVVNIAAILPATTPDAKLSQKKVHL